jgi:hypothetical protein
MNAESIQAAKLLEALAANNEELIELSCRLRAKPDVVEAVHGFSCRKYLSGAVIEGYVEVKVTSGNSVCWWLDVSWDEDEFKIETSVLKQTDNGQEVIHQFPGRTAETVSEFISELDGAISELVHSADLAVLNAY